MARSWTTAGRIRIQVRDVERSARLYEERLGSERVER
jgi:catechol-2,3-dioxygenase